MRLQIFGLKTKCTIYIYIQEGCCLSKQFISIANDDDDEPPQKYNIQTPNSLLIYIIICTPYVLPPPILSSRQQLANTIPKRLMSAFARICGLAELHSTITQYPPACDRKYGTMPSECSHKRTRQIYTHSRGAIAWIPIYIHMWQMVSLHILNSIPYVYRAHHICAHKRVSDQMNLLQIGGRDNSANFKCLYANALTL